MALSNDTVPLADIFEYTDYRLYLSDIYRTQKAKKPHFSYRYIASKVGFKSAGNFSRVLAGTANISLALALKFADFLNLNRRQSEYLQFMVLYNQAKNQEDRQTYFKRMLALGKSKATEVEAEKLELYQNWYNTVLREVLAIESFRGDYKELGAKLIPKISASEAKKAVELLISLGLIRKDSQGRFKQANPILKAGQSLPPVAVNAFILNALDLARHAIDFFPKKERMLSSTTFSLSDKNFEKMQNAIRELRELVLSMAENDDSPTRVYQLNFQVFPLTVRIGDRD